MTGSRMCAQQSLSATQNGLLEKTKQCSKIRLERKCAETETFWRPEGNVIKLVFVIKRAVQAEWGWHSRGGTVGSGAFIVKEKVGENPTPLNVSHLSTFSW